ncbi:MAG: hypothetical protein DMF00_06180 [Verrucomicrobia bacterium]|nr:MAG: hypothetical protein DMF00_06180 [Verrucomicrobiota bacterium]
MFCLAERFLAILYATSISPSSVRGKGNVNVRHQRFTAGAFPRRLRAWRERNNLSQSEAALKLQISNRTLQEWEQGRAAPRGFARTAIEKAIRA